MITVGEFYQEPEQQISEVNFNFTYKCNMACPFCYVPFNKQKTDDQFILKIFDRLIEIFPKRIVIGGGDPFMFDGLTQAVESLRQKGISVHIDSNLKRASEKIVTDLALLGPTLGFPIDGGAAAIHDAIRAEPGHFYTILERLEMMRAIGLEMKANTVVCRRNIESLRALASLLEGRGVAKWSLYQFWPMASGLKNYENYAVNLSEFEVAVDQIKAVTSLKIGGGSIDQRKSKYLFVRSDGGCYTVNPNDNSQYVELGSVFDQQTLKTWRSYGVTQMEATPLTLPIDRMVA